MRKLIQKLARSFTPTAAAASVSPAAVETLEDRRLCSSSMTYGLNANDVSSGTYGTLTKMLRDTGTHTIRLWLTVNSYSNHSQQGIFKYVKKFHADGFDTMLTVSPKDGLTASTTTVRSYFDWLAGQLGSSVDRWQIGNEPDKHRPWAGHLDKYVSDLLRPAYLALHAKGEKVVSAGVSWNPDDEATMVHAGMLNYCDFVGYHPYRNSVAQLKAAVSEVKALANGKPMIASEWNVRGDEGNKGEWASEIQDFWPIIRDNFYAAYYYAAVKTGTMAGAAAVITKSGGANGAFYSVYKGLKSDSSKSAAVKAASDVSSDDSSSDTTDDTTDTDSGPNITGFRIFDAVTGQVLYKNVSGSLDIDLSTLSNKQIKIRALAGTGTESIDFGFSGRGHRIEDDAPYSVFAKGGQASSWTAKAGSYTLNATGYTQDDAKGASGKTQSLILHFV